MGRPSPQHVATLASEDFISSGRSFESVSYVNSPTGIVLDAVSGNQIFGKGGYAQSDSLVNFRTITTTNHADRVDLRNYDSGVSVNLLEGNDRMFGSEFNDRIHTGSGTKTISAWGGSDTFIVQGGGNKDLFGGSGNDFFHILFDATPQSNILHGGEGTDLVSYTLNAAGVLADLTNSLNHRGPSVSDRYISIENLTGTLHNDMLYGSSSSNVINGLSGDDQIVGRSGNDTLFGGEGTDTIFGGVGADDLHSGGQQRNARNAEVLDGGVGDDYFRLDGHNVRAELTGDGSPFVFGDVFDFHSFIGTYEITDFDSLDLIDLRELDIEARDVSIRYLNSGEGAVLTINNPAHSGTLIVEYDSAGDLLTFSDILI